MAAPRKYPDELRERATRMAVDARRDPATRPGALRRVGEQLGINPETLRNWVVQAEVDAGARPGVSTEEARRIAELERENRELRRANAILKSASAFFAAEARPPTAVIVEFIDAHREEHGVETPDPRNGQECRRCVHAAAAVGAGKALSSRYFWRCCRQ